MKQHFELNGSKGWIFSIIFMIVLQSISIGYWAGGISKDVKNIKEDVIEIKVDIKDIRNDQKVYKEKT